MKTKQFITQYLEDKNITASPSTFQLIQDIIEEYANYKEQQCIGLRKLIKVNLDEPMKTFSYFAKNAATESLVATLINYMNWKLKEQRILSIKQIDQVFEKLNINDLDLEVELKTAIFDARLLIEETI